MKLVVDALVEYLTAQIAAGQTLAGAAEVVRFEAWEPRAARFPQIVVGQTPENIRANVGNRRRMIDAKLPVDLFVELPKSGPLSTPASALASARTWGDKLLASIAANPRLTTATYTTGFAQSMRASAAEPTRNTVGEHQVMQVTVTVEILYSEYPA